MEFKKNYCINLICKIKDHGSFVAVEKFNSNSSQHFQNYYKNLLSFNSCGEWFQNLDYPQIEIGNIVLVQINKHTNLWARGIISKLDINVLSPKIYLIDYQIFFDNNSKFELRVCPPKFSRLLLPTYNIDVNISLNNDDLKCAIKMLIGKNQHSELSFNFIPKSVQNNIYTGELIVNNKIDNSFIPLKKLLKNIHTIKYFNDVSKYKQQFSIFNPLKFKCMRVIFTPRDPNSIVFLNTNSSHSDINDSNYSLENLSYESLDEFSSALDYSEDFNSSDDSALEIKKTRSDCIVSIGKQKVYSSYSSLISTSNSSLHSNYSLEKKHSTSINPAQNLSNKCPNQNTKQNQESVVLGTITTNYKDEKSNRVNVNISSDVIDVDNSTSSCSKSIPSDVENTISQIEKSDIVDKQIEINISKEKYIMPMINRFNSVSKLSKYKDVECQQNKKFTIVHDTIESSKIISNHIVETKKCNDDSNVWWSSDDEN